MEEEEPVSMGVLEPAEADDSFPKMVISEVVSLAETDDQSETETSELAVPPLTPIAAPPASTSVVIVGEKDVSPKNQSFTMIKEIKMNLEERGKTHKSQTAMNKFLSSISDLYKCPAMHCPFTTNFIDFFDTHLKAHQNEVLHVWLICWLAY